MESNTLRVSTAAGRCCTKCGEEKPLSEFHRHKAGKFGVRAVCKACTRQQQMQYSTKNKEATRKRNAEYYSRNKEAIAEYYSRNKEAIIKQQAEYRTKNKEATRKRNAEYYSRNKEALNKQQAEYNKRRRAADPQAAMAQRIRVRLWYALNGRTKSQRTQELLGCSWQNLRAHLEAQFQPGMTWENRSEWHIDHIRPLASFDLTDEAQLREACHYTNLQPLWAKDNLSKGGRYESLPAQAATV